MQYKYLRYGFYRRCERQHLYKKNLSFSARHAQTETQEILLGKCRSETVVQTFFCVVDGEKSGSEFSIRTYALAAGYGKQIFICNP